MTERLGAHNYGLTAAGCAQVASDMTLYLDGAIDDDERERFELHVAACAPCRDAFDEIQLTIALLGSLDPQRLPSSITNAPERLAVTADRLECRARRNA